MVFSLVVNLVYYQCSRVAPLLELLFLYLEIYLSTKKNLQRVPHSTLFSLVSDFDSEFPCLKICVSVTIIFLATEFQLVFTIEL